MPASRVRIRRLPAVLFLTGTGLFTAACSMRPSGPPQAPHSFTAVGKSARDLPLPASFRNADDVLAGLTELKSELVARGDLRGIFAAAHLETGIVLRDWIRQGRFESGEQVEKLLTIFTSRYMQALASFQRSRTGPEAWRVAFEAAESDSVPVVTHLLLGINAHINTDLAPGLRIAGVDVLNDFSRRNFLLINEAMRVTAPRVRKEVAELYLPAAVVPGRIFGRAIDRLVVEAFVEARRHAWDAAVALATAPSPAAADAIENAIHDRAALAARRILQHRHRPFRGLAIMRAAGRPPLPHSPP